MSSARHWVSHSLAGIVFGVGITAVINASAGLAPYDAIAVYSAGHSHVPTWFAFAFLATVFMLAAWVLGRRPGPGTISNYLIVSATIAVAQPLLPAPQQLIPQLLQVTIGAALMGLLAGVVIASHHLGTGPYSQFVFAVSDRTGKPIWAMQALADSILLVLGMLALDVRPGWGTFAVLAAFPLLIPPGIRLGEKLTGARPTSSAP